MCETNFMRLSSGLREHTRALSSERASGGAPYLSRRSSLSLRGRLMPFFKSHPPDAGPANVFTAYPEIYAAWSKMSEALMNGPSPLTPAERELILAYAAGSAGCRFVCVAHSEVAYAHGIEPGLIERLLEDPG